MANPADIPVDLTKDITEADLIARVTAAKAAGKIPPIAGKDFNEQWRIVIDAYKTATTNPATAAAGQNTAIVQLLILLKQLGIYSANISNLIEPKGAPAAAAAPAGAAGAAGAAGVPNQSFTDADLAKIVTNALRCYTDKAGNCEDFVIGIRKYLVLLSQNSKRDALATPDEKQAWADQIIKIWNNLSVLPPAATNIPNTALIADPFESRGPLFVGAVTKFGGKKRSTRSKKPKKTRKGSKKVSKKISKKTRKVRKTTKKRSTRKH